MAEFGKHYDCRASNCGLIFPTYRAMKRHMHEVHAY